MHARPPHPPNKLPFQNRIWLQKRVYKTGITKNDLLHYMGYLETTRNLRIINLGGRRVIKVVPQLVLIAASNNVLLNLGKLNSQLIHYHLFKLCKLENLKDIFYSSISFINCINKSLKSPVICLLVKEYQPNSSSFTQIILVISSQLYSSLQVLPTPVYLSHCSQKKVLKYKSDSVTTLLKTDGCWTTQDQA